MHSLGFIPWPRWVSSEMRYDQLWEPTALHTHFHRKYKQTQSNPQALMLHRATHLNCDDHGSRLRQHCQLAFCVTQATRHKAHALSIHANSRINFMRNCLCNCIHLTQSRIINPVVILWGSGTFRKDGTITVSWFQKPGTWCCCF